MTDTVIQDEEEVLFLYIFLGVLVEHSSLYHALPNRNQMPSRFFLTDIS